MRDVTDLNEYRARRRHRLRLVHPAQGSLRLLSDRWPVQLTTDDDAPRPA